MQTPKAVHLIITNLIRLILFLTFIYALTSERTLVQVVSIVALLITFIPSTLEKLFNIKIPSSFEIIYLMFIYGLLMLGELRGFYHGLLWWNILMTFTASLALGFTGLSIIHVLHKTNRISKNPLFAAILIFSLSLSFGTLWEIFEYVLDTLIHSGLQKDLIDTMQDLSINVLGALLVSIAGYNHVRKGNSILASTFLTNAIERSVFLLGPKRIATNPEQRVLDLIQAGESSEVEFKSSVRTNLFTKQFDKKMEFEILKTVTAFLNTKGGNLLVGVNDEGEILGLEDDKFQTDDKLGLHVTNLIKSHIGNEFLPFIKFGIINMQGRKVLLVSCKESRKRVFLRMNNEEKFYIRNGPASVRLGGNALIDYIQHRF